MMAVRFIATIHFASVIGPCALQCSNILTVDLVKRRESRARGIRAVESPLLRRSATANQQKKEHRCWFSRHLWTRILPQNSLTRKGQVQHWSPATRLLKLRNVPIRKLSDNFQSDYDFWHGLKGLGFSK